MRHTGDVARIMLLMGKDCLFRNRLLAVSLIALASHDSASAGV